jgi:hypothetical protein
MDRRIDARFLAIGRSASNELESKPAEDAYSTAPFVRAKSESGKVVSEV